MAWIIADTNTRHTDRPERASIHINEALFGNPSGQEMKSNLDRINGSNGTDKNAIGNVLDSSGRQTIDFM